MSLSSRRLNNVAKLLAWRALDDISRMNINEEYDDDLAKALRELGEDLLLSMSHEAYERAEADLNAIRKGSKE
jgi:hypothetical protein